MNVNIAADKKGVARLFAQWLEEMARNSEKLTIALSGGSTPAVLFQLLAEQYKDKIDWTKLHFFWGDERCVPPDDEESNFKMANELLFEQVGVPIANIHRIKGEAPPAEEARRYAEEIKSVVSSENGLPVFDLIILGMGEDGHTASIFPNQMELLKETSWCAVAQHPESGQKRITLTGPVINNARQVAFLVTGASKAEKVKAVFSKEENSERYPAAHVRPEHGALHWFIDEASCELLK